LVLIIALFIVALVFDDFAGKGWPGLVIFAIGAAIGAMGHAVWKELKK
jgi:hypothetical protein